MEYKNEYFVNKKCYLCDKEPQAGIILAPEEVLTCMDHYSELYDKFITKKKKQSYCNLSQVLDPKQGSRITAGKHWEIGNRMISKDDGVTVINRKTGKEAQY